MAGKLIAYSADSQVKNLKLVFRTMFDGLRKSPYVAYRLFLKDLRVNYSKSKFGMFWDFVDPLVFASIFFILFHYQVIKTGDTVIPRGIFIIYGFLLYYTFMESILLPLEIMRSSKTLLIHQKMPPECLLLSILFRVLFNSAIRILILLCFTLTLPEFSILGFLKFILLYPALIIAGMSFGVFLAPFNVIYRDVGKFTKILLNPLRYITPVMWPLPKTALFAVINFLNPLTNILSNLRSVATQNVTHDMAEFFIRTALLMMLLLAGWFLFHIAIPVLAERA